MEQKYFVRKVIEYSCVVFQVVNKKTNCVAYNDKDEEIAKAVLETGYYGEIYKWLYYQSKK